MRGRVRLHMILATMTAVTIACGEETTGPVNMEPEDEGWGAAEQQSLLNALNGSGVLASTPAAGFASILVGTLGGVGGINTHEIGVLDEAVEVGIQMAVNSAVSSSYEGAVGVQIGYDVDGIEGWFSGIIGWNGMGEGGGAISQMVAVYHFDTDSMEPPATLSMTVGIDGHQQGPTAAPANHHLATAVYWDGTNNYRGTSGSLDITASTFSGSSDCSQLSYSCTSSSGTMSGTFEFESQQVVGEGTWTQVPVSFSGLTAVKLMISQSP